MGAPRKLNVDESFFEKIDSEEKAYILGFLYADGYVNVKGNFFVIKLNARDVDILEKIKMAIKSDAEIRYINNQAYTNGYAVNLQICSKKMCHDLVRVGCMQAKTGLIRVPNFLKVSFLRHFIRGYFDGDGGLSFDRKTNSYRASIVSNPTFIKHLNIVFKRIFRKKYYVSRYHKHRATEQIQISGNAKVLEFLHWIYKDSNIYLDRKFALYKQAIDRKSGWQRKIEVFNATNEKSFGVFNSFKDAAKEMDCNPTTLVKIFHKQRGSKKFRIVDLGRPLGSDCTLANIY